MRTRRTWLLGLAVLIAMGGMLACGSHFSSSSDGLVIVPSQGSAVLQAFSFNLSTGHAAQINTAPALQPAPSPGSQLPIVLDSTGSFAYVASSIPCSNTSLGGALQGGITAYKVNPDGTLAANGSAHLLTGNPAYTASGFPACGLDDTTNPNPGNAPVAVAMDSGGKFLFVATQLSAVTSSGSSVTLPGQVSVLSISSGSLTEVAGSPFAVPAVAGGTAADVSSLAVSPTSFPRQNAACSQATPPTAEYLYVADRANNVVFEFAVDTSSGALGNPGGLSAVPGFATGTLPAGVAVDPCNRFVYVANNHDNNVSGYTICNTKSLPNCPNADGSLVSTGAPTSTGNGPTAITVDPLGNFLYAVDNLQNAISGFKISSVDGTLAALTPATVATGANPVSIAIRSDDVWLFVANNGAGAVAGSLSQYSITPASGALSPLPAITTDNFPWGVAVK